MGKTLLQRFKNTNFEIITFGELNHKLLLFGADRLKKLHSYFPARFTFIDTSTSGLPKTLSGLSKLFFGMKLMIKILKKTEQDKV